MTTFPILDEYPLPDYMSEKPIESLVREMHKSGAIGGEHNNEVAIRIQDLVESILPTATLASYALIADGMTSHNLIAATRKDAYEYYRRLLRDERDYESVRWEAAAVLVANGYSKQYLVDVTRGLLG
jgi:hypothetical protein